MSLPLYISAVSKSFKGKSVLDNISAEAREGEIFGLIGLNGAGKTTMIKIMLGLLKQDHGSISIFGRGISQTETRRNLSFLPEKFYPPALLKGHEFLSLTLSYYGKPYDRDAACQKSEELGLEPLALEQKVAKYSKGMGQKLGLISAFLTGAPLLILDEPMSGLDPRARILLKDSLINYAKAGNTVFLSSHILADIDEICGNIAVLHDSRLIFSGTPSAFKKRHDNNNLERAFLSAIGS